MYTASNSVPQVVSNFRVCRMSISCLMKFEFFWSLTHFLLYMYIYCIFYAFIDIPQDSQGYKVFADKIMADLMETCRCDLKCTEMLFKDKDIVLKVQQFRCEYFGIPQGNQRSTKLLRLIRDSLITEHKRRFHHFQGKNICK